MSEKRHKKVNNQKPQTKEKQIVGTVNVDVFNNGSVRVKNFPAAPAQAIQVMAAAMIELAMYFIGQAAIEGQSKIHRPGQDVINLINRNRHGA
mgnify:CR=1 FL=1